MRCSLSKHYSLWLPVMVKFRYTVLLFLFSIGWWLSNPPQQDPSVPERHVSSDRSSGMTSSLWRGWNLVADHTFKRGDTLLGTLSVLGVPPQEISHIFSAGQHIYDLRKIIPGQKIKVFLSETPKAVVALLYEIDPLRSLRLVRGEGGFTASEDRAVSHTEMVVRQGVITDTLFESAQRALLPKEVVLNLTDIFAWDIDFSTEIKAGNSFRVAYEVVKRGDEIIRGNRIWAAEIVNGGRSYRAYFFRTEAEGHNLLNGRYYDEHGTPIEKTFLKSPMKYRHISARFTPRRFHPVLQVQRPHLGVDFAAPYGTPVMAAGDGIVSDVGWKGGYGNAVVIDHRGGYRTLYGHLASYGRGIRKGIDVRQGDVVGHVGSTGLSTGPHLHYTLYQNGVQINPINPKGPQGVAAKDVSPLSGEHLSELILQIRKMDRYLYNEGKGDRAYPVTEKRV